MAVTKQTLQQMRRLRVAVGSEADDATRSLTAAWLSAWNEIKAQMRAAVDDLAAETIRLGRQPHPWELARIARLQTALAAAEAKLAQLAHAAGVTVAESTGKVVAVTGDSEPHIIASQLPAAEQAAAVKRFAGRIMPTVLDAIVARTQARIVSQTRGLSAEATDAMQHALIAGAAAGSSPRAVAQDMLQRVEGGFAGGLSRAMTIARTELLDAYRTASGYAHASNGDVLSGWRWLATLDRRTCPACWAKTGDTYPVTTPGPWGHQNCRCARVPIVRPWSALGLPGNEPVDEFPDAQARFASLPEHDQLQIMGPSRLAGLRSGKIQWSQLATRRDAADWRPSFVPTPVRDLGGPLPRRQGPTAPPPPAPPVPGSGGPTGGGRRPLVGDLVSSSFTGITAREAEVRLAAESVFNGQFAGLDTEIKSLVMRPNHTMVIGEISDGGNIVGHFARAYERDDQQVLVVHHELLELNDDVRGQGFATALNGHLEDWYRESGVDRIELLANIDIGGYAWARSGYDFADATAASRIIGRLDDQIGIYEGRAYRIREQIAHSGATDGLTEELALIEDQISTAEAIVEDAQTFPFGDLGYPTAYRISQAGRWPGATGTDLWIGKAAMLRSSWKGVKPL